MPEDQNTPVATPSNVEVVERLTDSDKHSLDLAKSKRDLARSQSETAEATYNNVILRLALKYHLSDGDLLNEDGAITRKS
jgi:hypothetical protein